MARKIIEPKQTYNVAFEMVLIYAIDVEADNVVEAVRAAEGMTIEDSIADDSVDLQESHRNVISVGKN